jgi:hypothetical protein
MFRKSGFTFHKIGRKVLYNIGLFPEQAVESGTIGFFSALRVFDQLEQELLPPGVHF